ncbi:MULTISPECIES: SigE family RNA polymerase sigma factor [unclassified Nocardioides]|uniref:SigE family RNA polymerase sigma factor n=1 Tax=unclassified Nocardioides TaxID=2615069 RepID=UPI0006FE8B20|nr:MULTISPECIES: SigE family RNA polymerase sigma factor [unclassified Nocardioides]KQY57295.1 hypothetical protein ASD30_13795 [Nocardioides sp. Root140]KRF11939.1 hypothetical protein ASH02_18470 [Nocardioides sp. Soil796]
MFGSTRSAAREGYTAFAQESQQRLFRQAYLLAGDRAGAEDLVQSTLTALYVAWPRIKDPAPYAYRTLLREFLRTKKRGDRERELHRLGDGAVPDRDPSRSLTVLDALAALPDRMRAVVVLRYWEDLSVERTAELLGTSTGNVKSTASRGLARLRDLLGEGFEEHAGAAAPDVPTRVREDLR